MTWLLRNGGSAETPTWSWTPSSHPILPPFCLQPLVGKVGAWLPASRFAGLQIICGCVCYSQSFLLSFPPSPGLWTKLVAMVFRPAVQHFLDSTKFFSIWIWWPDEGQIPLSWKKLEWCPNRQLWFFSLKMWEPRTFSWGGTNTMKLQ